MTCLPPIAGLAAGAALLATTALAQGYPERQITMVVPFAAGGPTDTVARLVAERMSGDLGQQIVIENVGGAGREAGDWGQAGHDVLPGRSGAPPLVPREGRDGS